MYKSKLQNNIFYNFNKLQDKVTKLENEMAQLKKHYEKELAVQRCHLMRIKNKEQLSDDYILNGHHYHDFSPELAYDFYLNKDENFIVLDVSDKHFQPPGELPEAMKIPLEELPIRYKEIVNKTVPILIISEDGIKSILACELMNRLGHFNVNNISGGYKFWPAFRHKALKESELKVA